MSVSIKTLDQVNRSIEKMRFSVDSLLRFSRIQQVADNPFKVIDEGKIAEICNGLTEINDKIYSFSKSTSQVSRKLQSLVFMFPAPATYRVLHQILAQIEKKQSAVIEGLCKLEERVVKLRLLSREMEQEQDELRKELKSVRLKKESLLIAQSFSYLEASIKELGFLLEVYEQIKRNKGVPDDWSERDFEEQEVRAHVMGAFRLAIRDMLAHNKINVSTYEWFEQLGISPFEALKEVSDYLEKVFSGDVIEDYDGFMSWLQRMADKYAQCYKKACRQIGIDDIVSKKFTLGGDRDAHQVEL